MLKYYNCNFDIDDIIVGVNPEDKYTYLKIFKIKEINTHNEYGREIVNSIILEYRRETSSHIDIGTYKIIDGIKNIHRDFKRINTEWV